MGDIEDRVISVRYDFSYSDQSVYGHAVRLIKQCAVAGDVHLDFGCGSGAIAEPLRDAGLSYIGIDNDKDAVDALRNRGFEAYAVDLSDPVTARAQILDHLQGRAIRSASLLDVLEHLPDSQPMLSFARELSMVGEPAPLVVSVPNVGHRDLGIKLLTNRWEYTDTGLLDRTHLRFFTADGLEREMRASGWALVAAEDFDLQDSDQKFPGHSAVLSPATSIGAFLQKMRGDAGYGATINQFVRAYVPRNAVPGALEVDRENGATTMLSVILRTQGRRPETLRDALLCLAAQTCQDFEVLVTAHETRTEQQADIAQAIDELPADLRARTHLILARGGGRARPINVAIEQAAGRYIAVLDDDDTVFANWVQTFVELAQKEPGRLLRSVCASQAIESAEWSDGSAGFRTVGPIVHEFAAEFDLFDHLAMNRSPFMSLAFPRSVFHELGWRFNESLAVCEDWDLLLRTALLCGVTNSTTTTALYRRWEDGEASRLVHDPNEWDAALVTIIAAIDKAPTLFPAGHLVRLRRMRIAAEESERQIAAQQAEIELLRHERDLARYQVAELQSSHSWKLTRPVRAATDLTRAARRATHGRRSGSEPWGATPPSLD